VRIVCPATEKAIGALVTCALGADNRDMRQNINLVLAGLWLVLWLVVAGWLVYASYATPEAPFLRVLGTGMPVVWLALAMVAFSLVRWWAIRKQLQARSRPYSLPQRQPSRKEWSAPNPDFNFSDAPPRDKRLDPPPP
jgi:hypothetical protein